MGAAMPLLANGCYIADMLKDDIIQWVNSNGGGNVYHYHSSHRTAHEWVQCSCTKFIEFSEFFL